MKGELIMKVRVVRCPKCLELLQELADLDVYMCGGCGAILQAKRPKQYSVNSKLLSNVAVAARSDSDGSDGSDGSDVVDETRLEISGGDQKRSGELNGENGTNSTLERSTIPSSSGEELQSAAFQNSEFKPSSELNVNGSKHTSKSSTVEKPEAVKGNNSPFSGHGLVKATSSCYTRSSSEQLRRDPQSSYAKSTNDNGTADHVRIDETYRDILKSTVARSLQSDVSHESLQTQLRRRAFSSDLSCRNHNAMTEMKQEQSKLLDRNWKTDRHGYHSRSSNFPRPPRAGFRSGGISDQFELNYDRSSFDSTDMYENSDQEKMELLKMVHELEDRLQRSSYFDRKLDGSFTTRNLSKEACVSAPQKLEVYEREHLHEYNNCRYPRRCRHGSNWQQNYKHLRIPFSAEASTSRQSHDHPCIQCHAQDFRYSEELHPPFQCRKSGFCRFHLDHNCYICQRSCPPRPRRSVQNNHRSKSHEVENFSREKQQRHLRPLSGGAPFIICSNCDKLLQLPEEFLLFTRRCHLIKCGSCSKVLKFSLQDRSLLVSPSSMVVDSFVSAAPTDNPTRSFDGNRSSAEDHVSYSDEDELSVSKCTSSKDPTALSTVHHFHQSSQNRTRSHDSDEKKRDEGRLRHSSDKIKSLTDIEKLARPSSSMIRSELPSSDTEEQPSSESSPLHKLMGYSSPSLVIRGTSTLIQVQAHPIQLRPEEDARFDKA